MTEVAARSIANVCYSDLDGWGEVGGGGITFTQTSNQRVQFDSTAATLERVFLGGDFELTAGQSYVFSMDVVQCDATFSGSDVTLQFQETETAGDTTYQITNSDEGTRVGIRFTAAASIASTFRFGIGVGGNVAKTGTVIIENVTVQPVDSLTDYFDGYIYGEDFIKFIYPADYDAYAFDFASGNSGTISSTGLTKDSVYRLAKDSVGIATGDSQGNGKLEYVDRINNAGNTILLKYHNSGEKLVQIKARLLNDITQTNKNYARELAQPKYAILEGGINDVVAASSDISQTMRDNMADMVNTCRNAGIDNIIIVNIGPWKAHTSWTSDKQTYTDNYNAGLATDWTDSADVEIYDAFSALEDPENPDTLLSAYDSGDGLHWSVTDDTGGQVKVASDLGELITSIGIPDEVTIPHERTLNITF